MDEDVGPPFVLKKKTYNHYANTQTTFSHVIQMAPNCLFLVNRSKRHSRREASRLQYTVKAQLRQSSEVRVANV